MKHGPNWLNIVCVPLGIHLELINKELMLLVTISTDPLAQRENCAMRNKKLFGPMVHLMILSNTLLITILQNVKEILSYVCSARTSISCNIYELLSPYCHISHGLCACFTHTTHLFKLITTTCTTHMYDVTLITVESIQRDVFEDYKHWTVLLFFVC